VVNVFTRALSACARFFADGCQDGLMLRLHEANFSGHYSGWRMHRTAEPGAVDALGELRQREITAQVVDRPMKCDLEPIHSTRS
jgi:hypothetical protein